LKTASPIAVTNSLQSEIATAENLVAGYPGKIVWQGASFSFDRGELVAIIGPNGAGKTTLFRLLLGWEGFHAFSGVAFDNFLW